MTSNETEQQKFFEARNMEVTAFLKNSEGTTEEKVNLLEKFMNDVLSGAMSAESYQKLKTRLVPIGGGGFTGTAFLDAARQLEGTKGDALRVIL